MCVIPLVLLLLVLGAQDNRTISEIEGDLRNVHGPAKLRDLNTLSEFYQQLQSRKALRFARQAVTLGENLFLVEGITSIDDDTYLLVKSYYLLGSIEMDREDFFEARTHFQAGLNLAHAIPSEEYQAELEKKLQIIDDKIERGEIKEDFFSKTFGNLKIGKAIDQTTKDLAIQSEIRAGQSSERKENWQEAIDHYEEAIILLRDQGKTDRIGELQLKVATLLAQIEQHQEAQQYLNTAIAEIEKDLDLGSEKPLDTLAQINTTELPLDIEDSDSRGEQKNLKQLADKYAAERNYERSLEYYKLYQSLSQKIVADSVQTAAEKAKRINEIVLLRQQKEIADLNVAAAEAESQRQIRLRNSTIFIALFILVASAVVFWFYLTKRRQHRQLSIAYRDLDKTKGKLVTAEQKIIKLLRQQVSGDVAQELLMQGSDTPGERRFVCIMFLDIRDFTPMAEQLSPEELISYQNDVFGFMIDVVQKHNGNINQLLGDGFMATFGAPVSRGNDCQNAFNAAREILQEVRERSEAKVIPRTKVGIGLHAGYVVTGNVGNEARKQYSVTGNPVIIASRVEQLNKTYKTRLIITEEVYHKLEQPLQLDQPFVEVSVKGRSNPVRILKMA